MKFLIDANLPWKLSKYIKNEGFDVIHTDDLPNKERTPDSEILQYAENEDRVIITKDSDFLDTHMLFQKPKKLIYVSIGNTHNRELIHLFEIFFAEIVILLEKHNLIELNNHELLAFEN